MHLTARARSRLRRGTLLIMLGVLLNLLVAWGLGLLTHTTDAADQRMIQLYNPSSTTGHTRFYLAVHQWFGVHERQFYLTRRSRARPEPKRISVFWTWLPADPAPDVIEEGNRLFEAFNPEHLDNTVISTTRVGFPALALSCDTLVDDLAPLPDGTYSTMAKGGFFDRVEAAQFAGKPAIWSHTQRLWFPYRPIWSGFLINTAFYTLVVCALAWLWRQIKHARRMRRGLCPFCKYQLSYDFTTGCPECGWRRQQPANAL